MAKFNKKSPGAKTTNLAGGDAYSQNPKLELASILLTSFVIDQFYRTADDTIERVKALIPKVGGEFLGLYLTISSI